jgi:phage virion morphogenesis protein
MKPLQDTTNKLKKALANVPRLVGNDAVNHHKEAFIKQGWDGQKWKEVKRRIPGTKAYKYPKKKGTNRRTRGILIGAGSGRLKKSIRITQVTSVSVHIGTDVPYAQVHNEGQKAGRGKGFIMPKRQFMGITKDIEKMIEKRLDQAFDSVFN